MRANHREIRNLLELIDVVIRVHLHCFYLDNISFRVLALSVLSRTHEPTRKLELEMLQQVQMEIGYLTSRASSRKKLFRLVNIFDNVHARNLFLSQIRECFVI